MSRALLLLGTLLAACTARLEGPPRAPGEIALLHVGSTVVREIDGQRRRGGAFDVSTFELAPGRHRVVLVFELPARSIGLKSLPAQSGIGVCELAFEARAGRQYYLGARPIGDTHGGRWNGDWEGWVRDPATAAEDDIIARCRAAEPAVAVVTAAPTPSPAPAAVAEPGAPPPAPAAAAPAVAPVAAPTTRPARAGVRLGEWNLRSFGVLEKNIAQLAAAIDAHFDLLAILEVQGAGGDAALASLVAALGPAWAALPAAPAGGEERVAMLYRAARVRPCAGWNTLRPAGDASRFAHPPQTGCFTAGDADAPGTDLLLTAYRATWGDGDAAVVAAEVAGVDAIFAAMRAMRPGENDLVIVGDFNLDASELRVATGAANLAGGQGSVLDLLGNRTERRTDHVLVPGSDALTGRAGAATVLDLRPIAASPAEYYRTISDHLPLLLEVRVDGTDDD